LLLRVGAGVGVGVVLLCKPWARRIPFSVA